MAYTTIDDPGTHFKTKTYTGNGGTNAITGVGFAPDLVWIKHTSASHDWTAYNTTAGTEVMLTTNEAYAEAGSGSHGANSVTAFGSDGFTLGSNARSNDNNATLISFNWKANGGTRTTFNESGNNPGGGRQTNATAGFSLIDYTGTGGAGTIAHGLGVIPHTIFVHDRGGNNHAVYHRGVASDAATDYLRLDDTPAAVDEAGRWNDTAPTSSVITLGSNNEVNGDGRTYYAWVFAPIQGYSKFGSFIGNGLDDGPFIFTGFSPSFVMIKRTNNSGGWLVFSDGLHSNNEHTSRLHAEVTNGAQTHTYYQIDMLSNGFKLTEEGDNINGSSDRMVYWAFAKHPFVTSAGIPATAR